MLENGLEFASGEEYIDTISTGNPSLVIPQQSIGVAVQQSGFTSEGVDGVLGSVETYVLYKSND